MVHPLRRKAYGLIAAALAALPGLGLASGLGSLQASTGSAAPVASASGVVPGIEPADPRLQALVRDALVDAAQRAPGAPPRVRTARAVDWPDGAIGCPMPGRMYTQALVPGWQVVVDAGGRVLHYHAAGPSGWAFCPADRATEGLKPSTR